MPYRSQKRDVAISQTAQKLPLTRTPGNGCMPPIPCVVKRAHALN